MNAVNTLLRGSVRWLAAVLALGVLLRSAFVWIYSPGPLSWGDLIHAHSHTAYFGWAGLGLMGLILHVLPGLTGLPLKGGAALQWLVRLAPWAVGGALVSFAAGGYTPVSIGFSVANEVLWCLFAYVFWQNAKERRVAEWPPALWLVGGAVALLLVATLGTALVVVTKAVPGLAGPILSQSGVYLFLQAYGDGWLEVGLMGVVAAMVGGHPNRRAAMGQTLLLVVLMAPAALRLLAPFGLTGPLLQVGVAAGIGLAAAQVWYVADMARLAGRAPAAARPWWALAAGALLVKAGLELTPLLPGWVELARERQLVIAFLHLKLLLVVSAGMIGALTVLRPGAGRGWPAFSAGAVTMVGALAVHGLWAAPGTPLNRGLMVLAFVASVVTAVGAVFAVCPVIYGGVGAGATEGAAVR